MPLDALAVLGRQSARARSLSSRTSDRVAAGKERAIAKGPTLSPEVTGTFTSTVGQ